MRAYRLVPLLLLALLPATAFGSTPSTTIHVKLTLPRTAAAGAPIHMRVTITNRGPSVARGVTVAVGVEKITGAGARPGLILAEPIAKRYATLRVGQSKSFTLTVTVPTTPRGARYFGPGKYNIGPGINARSPLIVHISGYGKNVSKPNITLS